MLLFKTMDHSIALGFRIGLWILFRWLESMAPCIRYIEEEEVWYYRYPAENSVVPKLYLYILLIGVPALIYFLQYLFKPDKATIITIINQMYGISLAYCINGLFTNVLKIVVGRPRPNFYSLCFPDGYGNNINDECTGEYELQMEGRKSFPSAHSSFAFTGMTFLTLHIFNIVDFTKCFFARGIVFVLALTPIMLATFIAASRTCDYHHHFSDVIGGGLIGTIIAATVFFLYSNTECQNTELRSKPYEE